MDPGTADVVRAGTQLGNAAVTAAMGGLPRGAESRPSAWTAQMMLAGQNLVGNQAIASQATAPPATTPAVPGTATSAGLTPGTPAGLAPTQPVPVKPAPKKPPPAKPTGPKPEAPSAAGPDKKDLAAKDKSTEERPEKGAKKEKGAGPRSPGADPKFQALKKDVNTKKKTVGSSHPPAAAEAGAAQDAAEAPADDQEARGKAAHSEEMDAAQPKEFNKQEFVNAVKKAVKDKAPKNLDEADKFGESGKAEEVKTEVQGKVGEGKDASAQDIAETTAAPPEPAPDTKQVVPMAGDKVPGKPGAPNPAQAAPDQLPPSATDMSAGPDQVNQQMAEAKVTEQQLSFDNAREPQFDKAVKEKKSMDAHSEAAPDKLRADESRELKDVKKTAATQGTTAMAGIQSTRVATGQQVGTGKTGTKSKDEDKRKQVTDLLQKVFDQTKCDVEKILEDLDKKVDDQFTTKEKRARDRFTSEHEEGMEHYKDERYGGFLGKGRWVRDLFAGLPEEANRIYERARDNYLAAMDQIITEIADTVEAELKRAKDRIAAGRKELKTAVDKLPADLKAIGREAATEFEGKFDELKDTVNEKGTELVDTLATKYTEAVKSVDDEIAAEKEKNKGLVAKAADAIGGAIKAIIELGRMLMGVLRKAASAIGAILKDPIGFLGNLVTGVGGGLKLFMKNAGRHLEAGVLAWLLGTASTTGLQLPTSFDILGILTMIAMMLGLSWANIRGRLARRVPNQALVAAETAVPLVAQVKRRGVAGMWDDLKTRVGDLKKTLIKDLVSYLLPTIIIAGVTWIVSLFNPASAFIRACKMIIDIIRFIVTNAKQIIDFVNAVLDAVLAIARGGTGGVPALIERALAKAIPVLIGALAALLGIGGIAGKVKQIFQKIARPVNRAIDAVIKKITDLIKKLWRKLKPKKKAKAKAKKPKKPKDAKKKQPDDGRVLKPDWKEVTFSADRHSHRLWFVVSGRRATLMVASTEQSVLDYLDHVIADEKSDPKVKKKAQAARQLAVAVGSQANEIAKLAVHVSKKEEDAARKRMTKKQQELFGKQKQLADTLTEIFQEKNPIEPWLGKLVDNVPKDLLGYDVRPDSGKFLYGEAYSFLQIQRASGFGSADPRSFPMVHVDPDALVQKGAGILRADMKVIEVYRVEIATHQDKLKHDEAPDLAGNPDGLANQLENGANKQRPFNMGIRKQMEAIVHLLRNGGDLTGVEVGVGKKRVDYTARMRIDGRSQHVMIEYKHVTGKLSAVRRTELVAKLDAQLTGQIRGGRGTYTAHIINWPEFSGLDAGSQTAFREVIERAKELGKTMGVNVIWNG